jgi:CRISPR-associated protein Cas6
MIDVVFDLKGGLIPDDYAFELWNEVVRILPWLEAENSAGILPLRGSKHSEGLLLAKRTKLVVRLPQALSVRVAELSGQQLAVGSGVLQVEAAAARPFQPYPTLHAHLVESEMDEVLFLADISEKLQDLGVNCKWICGKRVTVTGEARSISGYSLVLHDLKPEGSLRVQSVGLGGNRRFGCGIFVPYKEISGLD